MMTISKKEDILIPFSSMSDPDWYIYTQIILDALAVKWNSHIPPPISKEKISSLENKLGTHLPDKLKLFYETFGLADIGEELQDFETIEWLKDIWPQDDVFNYGPEFSEEDKKLLPYLVTFSDYLGNGNMFCFHSETHEIYYLNHEDHPLLHKMFASVDEYIKGCLIFAQADLFDTTIEQKKVEKWTEEIVKDLYDNEVVNRWIY